jgi:ubiquitin-protein ligase
MRRLEDFDGMAHGIQLHIPQSKRQVYAWLFYKGSPHQLCLSFPDGYPQIKPHVKFITTVDHPSIDCDGNICLDVLNEDWSPVYGVRTILLSVQALLHADENEKKRIEVEKTHGSR